MKVKLIKFDLTVDAKEFDKKTKNIKIKIFGKLCSFRADEYEVLKDDKTNLNR